MNDCIFRYFFAVLLFTATNVFQTQAQVHGIEPSQLCGVEEKQEIWRSGIKRLEHIGGSKDSLERASILRGLAPFNSLFASPADQFKVLDVCGRRSCSFSSEDTTTLQDFEACLLNVHRLRAFKPTLLAPPKFTYADSSFEIIGSRGIHPTLNRMLVRNASPHKKDNHGRNSVYTLVEMHWEFEYTQSWREGKPVVDHAGFNCPMVLCWQNGDNGGYKIYGMIPQPIFKEIAPRARFIDTNCKTIPEADEDADGVADRKDKCLGEKGSTFCDGCPDRDNDRIPDREDLCKEVRGLKRFQGCPDTDGDDIPDHEDDCDEKKGPKRNKGCPEPISVALTPTPIPPAPQPSIPMEVEQKRDTLINLFHAILSGRPLSAIPPSDILKYFTDSATVEVQQCASSQEKVTRPIAGYVPALDSEGYGSVVLHLTLEPIIVAAADDGPWTIEFTQHFEGKSKLGKEPYEDCTLKSIEVRKVGGKYLFGHIRVLTCLPLKKCK